MCFSAEASFGAGALLTVVGIVTIKKANSPSQYAFASIPFIFAVQQITEGILWTALTNSEHAVWQSTAKYIFLVFAQIAWPVWVPLSIMLLEKEKKRKKILSVILGMGSVLAVYLAFCLITFPVESYTMEHHIRYQLNYPHRLIPFTGIFYFIPTVISPFISSLKRMQLLGVAIFVSYVNSKFFFAEHVISVWCFFAAILSVVVYWIIGAIVKDSQVQPELVIHEREL